MNWDLHVCCLIATTLAFHCDVEFGSWPLTMHNDLKADLVPSWDRVLSSWLWTKIHSSCCSTTSACILVFRHVRRCILWESFHQPWWCFCWQQHYFLFWLSNSWNTMLRGKDKRKQLLERQAKAAAEVALKVWQQLDGRDCPSGARITHPSNGDVHNSDINEPDCWLSKKTYFLRRHFLMTNSTSVYSGLPSRWPNTC